MDQSAQIAIIEEALQPMLEGSDMFLTDIRIKPTNNCKVFIDADSGMSIDKCVSINRALYKIIEEKGIFPDGDFSLEVSSPGVDEPLKQRRQFHKNIGRELELTLADDKTITGVLKEITEAEEVVLTVKEGKKKVLTDHTIPFADIQKAVVQISFKS